jgi:hypothetical protein
MPLKYPTFSLLFVDHKHAIHSVDLIVQQFRPQSIIARGLVPRTLGHCCAIFLEMRIHVQQFAHQIQALYS